MKKFKPPLLVLLSFFLAILFGTLLLYLLPTSNEKLSLVDAIFTATSSVCVTGLIVKNTPLFFNSLGQFIILFLIQIGGLGIMTLYATLLHFLRGISKKQQIIMKEILNEEEISGITKTILFIIKFTIIVEGIGAILLFINWWGIEESKLKLLWISIFHSVSAFCNAGFSLFPNSLEDFLTSPTTLLIFSFLIILGGICLLYTSPSPRD